MAAHLVLGHSGFLGEELSSRLLSRGHKVIGVDLTPSQLRHPNLQEEILDIRSFKLSEKFKSVTHIHHCASLVPLARNRDEMLSVNVGGTQNILNEIKKQGCQQFLYYSTSAVTGFHPDVIPEDAPAGPVEIYGESKLRAEELVQKSGLPFVIIRPRTIIGKGRLGLFELLFSRIKNNKTVFLPGPGTQAFQMISVSDLLNAVEILMERDARGVFHVGNVPSESLKEDLEQLIFWVNSSSKIMPFPKEIVWALKVMSGLGINPIAPWQYLAFNETHLLSTKRLEALGWKPEDSNLEMLKLAFLDFNSHKPLGQSLHRKPMDLLKFGFMK